MGWARPVPLASSLLRIAVTALAASLALGLVASPLSAEPRVETSSLRSVRKDALAVDASTPLPEPPKVAATLVQVHTDEHVPLEPDAPLQARFDELLADRTTGEHCQLDPRLLGLLRQIAERYPSARIELVSGFRSPKLNERLRKKGHNVASHSQHSLGHAVDFRVVPDGETLPLEPARVEKLVRELGWKGGVGIYPTHDDRFVHCDVGPLRRWMSK